MKGKRHKKHYILQLEMGESTKNRLRETNKNQKGTGGAESKQQLVEGLEGRGWHIIRGQ